MKRIIALVLIISIICPFAIFAQTESSVPSLYIFGDDWAFAWGNELGKFSSEKMQVVNCSGYGELLSRISEKPQYALIKEGDVVVLSYGILEKDRPGDKNAEFKAKLNNVCEEITKKGATVVLASVCSTLRINDLTGRVQETRNFYTETTRAYAKEKGYTYIDLSNLTASWANKLENGKDRLYSSVLSLTETGNRMCAYEVFKALDTKTKAKGLLQKTCSRVYNVASGEMGKTLDVFYEALECEKFAVYIKNGVNVYVNGTKAPDGDSVTECVPINGVISLTFSSCEKIQTTPVYTFNANGFSTGEKPFEGKIAPGVYDVTVKKTEPLKASVYLNDYLIASNLDMPGSQPVNEPWVHTYKEYHHESDSFSVKVTGLTDKLDFISFRETEQIYDDVPRIFVAGDSTVCNYYPLDRTGNEEDGTVMTGWAMLLYKYVDADIVNLAASGDWASKWKKSSFNIVEKEGKKGDIFIIQFGINDRYNSTLEEMNLALSTMIDTCARKGMIPILVSPQISAGYGWGNKGNMGKSDGGDYVEYFDAVRKLSEEKGCFYVDLTDLSSGWFSEIGRDAVYKKYHLWDYENDKPGDMMHLSYKGADAMCRFFVLGLKKISDTNKTDFWGNTLNLLKIW